MLSVFKLVSCEPGALLQGAGSEAGRGELTSEYSNSVNWVRVRGCPHYASRRRASRRGPSGVVCLDTWAMRRDYSRLQA